MPNLVYLALHTDLRNNPIFSAAIENLPNLRAVDLSSEQTSLLGPLAIHCPLVEVVKVAYFEPTDSNMSRLGDFER